MRSTIVILGGDEREIEIARIFEEQGFNVKLVGFNSYPHELAFQRISLEAGLGSGNVFIAPLAGTDEDGILYTVYSQEKIELKEDNIKYIKEGSLFLIGRMSAFLKKSLEFQRVKVLEVVERDEVAILNSVPTAEGAVKMAIEETRITIHKSRCLVTGFGRCGITLSRLLYNMGARVAVAARDGAQLARAWEMGLKPLTLKEMEREIFQYDIIFNTIPEMILKSNLIDKLKGEAVIIDIASSPGGTDFDAAARRGLKARLAPGLPGMVAPKTAGQLLARIYLRLLEKHNCINA
ncbi:MAG: dipicolinate synthase subunit DpsA [Candidatus Syntrophonatronum acetioxidans]|uniref:Dipicolinate synthase subunit DpsA n=1 Tax=Candidatus Syntrophonatronum acetioxidans TaxID=1795816 RepID=A0A424YDZ2_9FIRM|nr:MAG: dipicolinate synthase subunit DpsA [Candidatus Syntrophonatronum acetioxidans]